MSIRFPQGTDVSQTSVFGELETGIVHIPLNVQYHKQGQSQPV